MLQLDTVWKYVFPSNIGIDCSTCIIVYLLIHYTCWREQNCYTLCCHETTQVTEESRRPHIHGLFLAQPLTYLDRKLICLEACSTAHTDRVDTPVE